MWLKTTGIHKPLLVCHNGKTFDSVILMKSVMQNPECGLESTLGGFVDSLHVFREVLPGRPSYKLEALVKDTMEVTFNAHSALEDVRALQALVIHHQIANETMLKHSFDTSFVVKSIETKNRTDDTLSTLSPLSECISEYMLKKIARSGLTYNHLKLALERGGAEGLKSILGEQTESGSVRVTKNKTIVTKIYDHFC
jgi:DNA polymerase III epsilon subunit-like protein